jgi:broad specificity phosphatase PhoE
MMRTTAASLRAVNPDLLVSSEYTRAIESARIIGQRTGLTPVANGLFYEIVRPSKFYNTSTFHFETFWFVLLSMIHKNNPIWRYADAENAHMISDRARRALAYIESLRDTHNSVVIVSHNVFINIMVAYMCKNSMLGFWEMLSTFLRIRRMKNASVIHLEYVGNGSPNTCNWRVVEDLA